jgi:hypothetical protein
MNTVLKIKTILLIPFVFLAISILFAYAQESKENQLFKETSKGQTVLLGTWVWDIEANSFPKRSDSEWKRGDIWWEQDTTQFLVPRNGSGLSIVLSLPYENITPEGLTNMQYSQEKIPNSYLVPGAIVAVRTTEGNLAKVRVIRYRELHDFSFKESENLDSDQKRFLLSEENEKNYHLEVEWVLYRKE